ncbi:unnamed protein product [Urochloa decumbens]|uniref:Uncharacterized protein n=1 Tax=Urochloa decumbens TaxID=240449 RepID=A0ABC8X266_9POAL
MRARVAPTSESPRGAMRARMRDGVGMRVRLEKDFCVSTPQRKSRGSEERSVGVALSPCYRASSRQANPRMEHTHYPESGADGRDALMREEISPYCDPEDSEDDLYWDDPIKYDLSVWVASLKDVTDDVPQIPPPFIVHCRDLLEKGWGWQRLVPYCHGNVDWTTFKEYLKEYFIQNAGEIAALCANKKPEKDKDYFCRITGGVKVKDKSIYSHNVSVYIQGVVADMCVEMENNFRFIHRDLLTAEDIILSEQIEERANYLIQSPGGYANAAAALVCIVKEIRLLSEILDCKFDTTEMVNLSKKVRQSAYKLMLYEGPESAAAAGALLGLAKEAKFLCYVLSREDGFMHRDCYCCHAIRRDTVEALDMLLQETSNYGHVSWALVAKPEKPQGFVDYLTYASDNGDVNVASAVAESEKPEGTVVDLNCASDNGDVASAGAKSEKPEGTVGYLNCEVLDSIERSKGDLNDCCEMDRNAKFGLTINKYDELEGHLEASESWKCSPGQRFKRRMTL